MTRKQIHTLRRDGVDLATHCWLPDRPLGAVFYLHGLQSHAGWLWEVGRQYAEHGAAFFVLDRRGCGLSEGDRGDIVDVDTVVGDYQAAATFARDMIGDEVPLCLFGHCLGGSFLAALLHHDGFTVRYDSVIFCSAPLGRMHATLSTEERSAIAADRRTELWDAGLHAEDFTETARYRDFIESDDLAVRRITRRGRVTLLRLEELYLNPERGIRPVPIAYASGRADPVIDLDSARAVFHRIADGRGTTIQFPTDKHYLYYTDASAELIRWSASVTLTARTELPCTTLSSTT